MKWCVLGLMVVAGGCSESAAELADQPATGFSKPAADRHGSEALVDLDGQELKIKGDPAVKAIALIFILPDCPICNAYIPELNRLHESFSNRGGALVLVHADQKTTADEARGHAEEYRIQLPVVLDPHHAWVKKAGATTAPEAAVVSPGGEILYRGRIDNQYAGLGKRRAVVTNHDLQAALEAILAGQPIAEPRTEAIGCPIPESSRGD